jgi:hypothetical protein
VLWEEDELEEEVRLGSELDDEGVDRGVGGQ